MLHIHDMYMGRYICVSPETVEKAEHCMSVGCSRSGRGGACRRVFFADVLARMADSGYGNCVHVPRHGGASMAT